MVAWNCLNTNHSEMPTVSVHLFEFYFDKNILNVYSTGI